MAKHHHNNNSDNQQSTAIDTETLVDADVGSVEDIIGSEDVTTTVDAVVDSTTVSTVTDPVVAVEPEPEAIIAAPVVEAPVAIVAPVVAAPAPVVQPTAPVAQASTEGELKLSTMGKIAMHNIADYMENMKPGKQVFPADGARHQVSLYRALLTILNGNADEFTTAFSAILKLFNDNADGVFRDTHVFRFTEQMTLGDNERKAFQRLLNLIKLTADPKSRGLALKQINMSATMEFGVNDQGRQNILNFYGV